MTTTHREASVDAPPTRHPSLQALHDLAARLSWRCLSLEWKGNTAKYVFECQNGHRVERTGQVRHKTPSCVQCEADAIRARCLANVASHGGVMLDPFKGLQERHRLRCASGHEWATLGIHTSNGKWCPVCAREQRALAQRRDDGLERLQAIAAAKGGRCLAEAYERGQTRYPFECAKGHRWEAKAEAIIRGTWCRKCADAEVGLRSAMAFVCQDGLKRLQEAARAHAGECLSCEYTNQRAKYRFRCSAGHEWMQSANVIWQGAWCARCAHLAQRTPIEALQEIAAARGGKCLSPQTGGMGVKLTWECQLGHVWQAEPSNVKSGSWCPTCAVSAASEKRVRRAASVRARRRVDPSDPQLKRLQQTAAALGWRCLSREWMGSDVRYDFECTRGHRLKRHASYFVNKKKGNHQCEECRASEIKERWLATVARHDGVLLGTFTGLNERYRLRCAQGHEWETLGSVIRTGSWCPHCGREESGLAHRRADGLERLQTIATAKGGQCLAHAYEGTMARYAFECSHGHRWEASGASIAQGSWCPRCARIAQAEVVKRTLQFKDGLQRLHEIARQHKGECLSTEYTGAHQPYAFRCEQGHEWTQRAAFVWQGHWCRRCADLGRRRISIEQLREIAASRGGMCLSTALTHSSEKLEFKCHLGHVWRALSNNIKKGRWCPNCAILDRTKNLRKRKRYDFAG